MRPGLCGWMMVAWRGLGLPWFLLMEGEMKEPLGWRIGGVVLIDLLCLVQQCWLKVLNLKVTVCGLFCLDCVIIWDGSSVWGHQDDSSTLRV